MPGEEGAGRKEHSRQNSQGRREEDGQPGIQGGRQRRVMQGRETGGEGREAAFEVKAVRSTLGQPLFQ